MRSTTSWMGNQIKSFVTNNIPSWNNFSNNPNLNNTPQSMVVKPPLNVGFIVVDSTYAVELADETEPFTVKKLYAEEV